MPLLFNESPKYLLTSESVTEGHPDKLCDQISDAVLDAVLSNDPTGRVACETAVTNGLVMVMGEITTNSYVDVPGLVRETLRNAGYTNADYGIDAKSCGVSVCRASTTGANAETINDSGETTSFSRPPSSQAVRIDIESLPTGILIPSAGHSSMPTACTVS